MEVKIILTPHVIRNCKDADDAARKMATFFATHDPAGTDTDIVCVYSFPAANPKDGTPQYDLTILLKQTVPAE